MKVRQLVAILAVAISPLSAQQPRVAVAPFETEGSVGMSREDFDALGRALGAILTTEMAERRGGAASAIGAPTAGRTGRLDLAAARDRATKAGGTLLIIGTLLDQYGDINVEARVLDAATGASVAVVRGDPTLATREQLGEAVAELALRLSKEKAVGGVPEARWRRTLSAAALVQFGRGLRFEEAGDKGQAATAYKAAVAAAPTLTEAKAALTRVGG
ncbi:MAG: hypothetical protein V9E87_12735 [Gemmatimonadales bacterium]